MLLVAVVGCGSVPEKQHEGVEAVNEAMTHGMRAYGDDRYLEARQLFSKGLALYRSMDNPQGALVAYVNLVDVALVTGDFAAAQLWLDDALRLAAAEDDQSMHNRLSYQSIHLEWLTLEPGSEMSAAANAGLHYLTGAISEIPDLGLNALFLRTQIELKGDDENAGSSLQQLREIVTANPSALYAGRLARLEAESAYNHGNFSVAKNQLLEAQRRYREENYRPGLAAVHEELSMVEEQQDNLDTALFHAEKALFIRLWITDRHHSEALFRKLARFETTLGNADRANDYLALAEFVAVGSEIEWNTMHQRLRAGKIN